MRIGACLMVAPVFGASYVPPRMRIVLARSRSRVVLLPLIPRAAGLTLLSADGVVTTAQQVLIGVAMGFCLQLMFDALTLGGQMLANGMGLGFAFNIDPLRGVDDAGARPAVRAARHADLPRARRSHRADRDAGDELSQPAGRRRRVCRRQRCMRWSNWGSSCSPARCAIALPGMTALLVINLAFGVISRAAPALNLFAVGLSDHAGVRTAGRAARAAEHAERP